MPFEGGAARNSYARTALTLRTLEGILGRDAMLRVMRTWFQRRRYTHPTASDFFKQLVITKVSGHEYDSYGRRG